MRYSQLLLVLSLLATTYSICAQTDGEEIDQIRKWFVETENRVAYCDIVEVDDWADEANYSGYQPVITGYFDRDLRNFIRIDESGSGDWHEETTSYYLNEGELYFIFSRGYYADQFYEAGDFGMTEDAYYKSGREAKTLLGFEERIYFVHGEVVKYLHKHMSYPAEGPIPDLNTIGNYKRDINDIDGFGKFSHVQKILSALNARF